MEEDRVRIPRIRAPKQDYVRLFNLSVGTCPPACTENRRQTGDARGMSSSVAAVNVVGAHDAADEFLRRVVQFVDGLGATEHAKISRVVLRDGFAERRGHTIHGLIPGRGTMRTVLPHQRLSQAGFRWLRHETPK
jgi:hypothetical protein